MTPERYRRLIEVLNLRQPDLTVIADEVHKGRNLSAIVRTCDSVGIDTIHMVAPKKGYRGYQGTASGSHKWVHVETHTNLSNALKVTKQAGMQVVAAAISRGAINFVNIDYTRPTALLLGSEKAGVSEEALRQADHHVIVPMVGMVESLNVSVAAAIILQEAQRQRQEAGMYGTNCLNQEVKQTRFFRWAHPKVAEFCDAKNIPYPEVSTDDGEIIEPSKWYNALK